MQEIRRVGVLGCGLMGSGIAQVCAQSGYDTIVREISDDLVEKGIGGITRQLGRAVEKGKLGAEDRDATVARLSGTTRLEDLADCDLVIEAVVENLDMKNEMWRTLDAVCGENTIFASNTSSLTIADMAAATKRPGRMLGLHFFNPVPVMKLVEVVRTIATEPEVFRQAFEFARSLGKEPIECKDNSGFVVNLLLVPYMMDAIRALEQGVASIEDIDKGMRLGTGYPMGPFTLCDFVGNDTLDKIGGIMFDEYKEKRYASPPLLREWSRSDTSGGRAAEGSTTIRRIRRSRCPSSDLARPARSGRPAPRSPPPRARCPSGTCERHSPATGSMPSPVSAMRRRASPSASSAS
jgi:3-hydroxybutyryl-CoA dehydrogenase